MTINALTLNKFQLWWLLAASKRKFPPLTSASCCKLPALTQNLWFSKFSHANHRRQLSHLLAHSSSLGHDGWRRLEHHCANNSFHVQFVLPSLWAHLVGSFDCLRGFDWASHRRHIPWRDKTSVAADKHLEERQYLGVSTSRKALLLVEHFCE